jgi:hypothetical protein
MRGVLAMTNKTYGLALRTQPVELAGSLSTSFRLFALHAILIFSFVPVLIYINLSQIFLFMLCAVAFCCYLVRLEADIFAAFSLVLLIAVSQAIGLAHFSTTNKNYLTPFLFIASLLIAPAMMLLARSCPSASRDRIVSRAINWILVFLIIECVSRLIFSPHMGVTAETDVSDSFYRYKFSLFFVDSNFVGIAILCLLPIMFAYREAIGQKKWVLIYLLLLGTLSRASIVAGICQLIVYKLWRWRMWTLFGLLAAQVLIICKLYMDFTMQGAASIQTIDGSLSSKVLILARMTASYAQADALQRFFGVGVGNSINLIGIFAHNIVATFALELGIGGSLLFLIYIWMFSRRCPASFYLLILPIVINGFSLVSTSMPYFFVALGLLAALRGTWRDGSGAPEK